MNLWIFPTVTAFFLTLLFIPLIIKLSLHFGWYDSINDRKIHSGKIPRLGGVGFFLSFLISFFIFYFFLIPQSSENPFFFKSGFNLPFSAFFLSLILIFIVGVIDDFYEIRALYKLFAQIFIAIFFLSAKFYFKELAFPFLSFVIKTKWILIPLTFFWYIGIINAVNLIDGMDGLCAGVSLFAFITSGVVGMVFNNPLLAFISFITSGTLLAYLIFNLPPAKIFMGDGGSLFLGTLLSILPFIGDFSYQNSSRWIIYFAILLLVVPIFDTLSAIFRRIIIKKESFFIPDKEHIHHKLLFLTGSTQKTLLIIYALSFLGSLSAGCLIFIAPYRSFLFTVAILIQVILFLIITILYKKKNSAK